MKQNNETETAPDSLELAKDAINYVLERVQQDPNIRYHMGAMTESFERLKAAHCALNGISDEAVEDEVFNHDLDRKADAEVLHDIKELIYQAQSREMSKEECLVAIAKMLDIGL